MATPKKPNSSLDDLKKALEKAEPVMVDESGHLISEGDMNRDAYAEKNGNGAPQANVTRLKPTRWF
jgi:hypothetical protein